MRGHPIIFHNELWVYEDTLEPVHETWKDRACGYCGKDSTKEGHDACLGTLPGVMNACCGHGIVKEAYIQFLDSRSIHGYPAKKIIEILKESNNGAHKS